MPDDDGGRPHFRAAATACHNEDLGSSINDGLPIFRHSFKSLIGTDSNPSVLAAHLYPFRVRNTFMFLPWVDLEYRMNLEAGTAKHFTHALAVGAIQK